MPEKSTDAAAKLKKLGERIRDCIAKRHPIADKNLDIVRQTVREEWQREQTAKRGKPSITPEVKKTAEPVQALFIAANTRMNAFRTQASSGT